MDDIIPIIKIVLRIALRPFLWGSLLAIALGFIQGYMGFDMGEVDTAACLLLFIVLFMREDWPLDTRRDTHDD